MVQERQTQGKAVCWTLRLWSVAVVSMLLLSTCFIVSGIEKMWASCPNHWKSFGSSCYLICTKENFWIISEQNCVQMGAHLVVINTEAEQNFIIQQLNESRTYFLGLSDPQGNGKWQWIDNTPFSQNIRFWHPQEPNLPEEQCASIVYWNPLKWGWNDVFCDNKHYSICQMKKIYL
ncbi:C-type lectin domain family 6 member A isoform X3 [Grammomys surdaster]|uniref:C-type lectin domain family 6 member A isoform X3 n=1 Tax=Grammomys surdaster TaxID=491861 RepID=UPI00109FC3D2|nr:C-type lectin domain family 6 member A isoform X3 [Grammomys surdaster]